MEIQLYRIFLAGSFFLPRDQQRKHPARNTDYEGLAYLGEFPLSWSACCANESVYNLLLDTGANPDMQDSFGNMILHMVVVGDKLVSDNGESVSEGTKKLGREFNGAWLGSHLGHVWIRITPS